LLAWSKLPSGLTDNDDAARVPERPSVRAVDAAPGASGACRCRGPRDQSRGSSPWGVARQRRTTACSCRRAVHDRPHVRQRNARAPSNSRVSSSLVSNSYCWVCPIGHVKAIVVMVIRPSVGPTPSVGVASPQSLAVAAGGRPRVTHRVRRQIARRATVRSRQALPPSAPGTHHRRRSTGLACHRPAGASVRRARTP